MFFSEFDTLLMYINLQTRSHIFLKISIFCKKIITFSISAHLMKKSTFLTKFQFFSHKIDTFAPKLILTETLVTLPQSLHDIILSMNLEIHSFAKKWRFLHKMLFFTKRKQCHQKLTLFKNRKINIFENGDHLLKKGKNPSKLVFLQDFRFYQWSTHNEKINTCRTNCHIFTELTTKILLKPIVISPKIDN